jgi:hypothetical protein
VSQVRDGRLEGQAGRVVDILDCLPRGVLSVEFKKCTLNF